MWLYRILRLMSAPVCWCFWIPLRIMTEILERNKYAELMEINYLRIVSLALWGGIVPVCPSIQGL